MDEIEKYRDLLALLRQMNGLAPPPVPEDGVQFSLVDGEDEEASQWATWILAANGTLLAEARIRTCRSGLAAVTQYMAEREAA